MKIPYANICGNTKKRISITFTRVGAVGRSEEMSFEDTVDKMRQCTMGYHLICEDGLFNPSVSQCL